MKPGLNLNNEKYSNVDIFAKKNERKNKITFCLSFKSY